MKTLSIQPDLGLRARIAATCAVAALGSLAIPSTSLACKCAPPPGATEALKQATAVFEAQVTQLNEAEEELEVSMRVVRAWKGVESETVRVRTRRETAACGIPFEAGKSYVVYATQTTTPNSSIALEAFRCGRTRPAEEADEDFRELGLGVVPVAPREPATNPPTPAAPASEPAEKGTPKPVGPAAGGCASCSVGHATRGTSALLPLFGLALLAAVATRRRRAGRRSRVAS